MRMKLLIGAIVIASLGLGVAWAFGPLHHGHGRPDPEEMAKLITFHVNDTLDELKANDAQRATVLAVKDRLLAEGKKLHEGHAATHEELLRQWGSASPDKAKLHALADAQVEELRGFLHQAVDAFAEVHATLTPEQRAQLVQEFQKHHK